MLPLSYDLANSIGIFRRLVQEHFLSKKKKEEILKFIHSYLYVDDNTAQSIYQYCKEQYEYIGMPHDRRIFMEYYHDGKSHMVIFHTLYGRRVNDCLSRAVAFAIARTQHKDVELGISDNGFFLRTSQRFNAMQALKLVKSSELPKLMNLALEKTEVLRRRFRHCAMRSLMILRIYRGHTKRVGRQSVSSMILMNAVKRIDENFFILREAKREVLEDLMDIHNTVEVLKAIESKKIKVDEISTTIPSPFAFNLVLEGYTDILKIDDRLEFLQRMHQMVLAKIGKKVDLNEEKFELPIFMPERPSILEEYQQALETPGMTREQQVLVHQVDTCDKKVPVQAKLNMINTILGTEELSDEVAEQKNYQMKSRRRFSNIESLWRNDGRKS